MSRGSNYRCARIFPPLYEGISTVFEDFFDTKRLKLLHSPRWKNSRVARKLQIPNNTLQTKRQFVSGKFIEQQQVAAERLIMDRIKKTYNMPSLAENIRYKYQHQTICMA